eukprot:768674-Hanusia_phi.AAC.4
MTRTKTGRKLAAEVYKQNRIWIKGETLFNYERLAIKKGFTYANGVWQGQGDVNSFIQAVGGYHQASLVFLDQFSNRVTVFVPVSTRSLKQARRTRDLRVDFVRSAIQKEKFMKQSRKEVQYDVGDLDERFQVA